MANVSNIGDSLYQPSVSPRLVSPHNYNHIDLPSLSSKDAAMRIAQNSITSGRGSIRTQQRPRRDLMIATNNDSLTRSGLGQTIEVIDNMNSIESQQTQPRDIFSQQKSGVTFFKQMNTVNGGSVELNESL